MHGGGCPIVDQEMAAVLGVGEIGLPFQRCGSLEVVAAQRTFVRSRLDLGRTRCRSRLLWGPRQACCEQSRRFLQGRHAAA